MTHTTNVVTIAAMALGSNVRKFRERAGLTQTQLAERAGMDQQALAALEKRDSKSSQFTPNLALALGVSIDRLLGTPQDELQKKEPDAGNLVRPEEILQLITLFSEATEDGRAHILRMARQAEKQENSGRASVSHD